MTVTSKLPGKPITCIYMDGVGMRPVTVVLLIMEHLMFIHTQKLQEFAILMIGIRFL